MLPEIWHRVRDIRSQQDAKLQALKALLAGRLAGQKLLIFTYYKRPEIAGSDQEIAILISTDVLSEGQNLQDCAHLLNYDLHWNPTRMAQRAGRIDRIGTDFETLFVHNTFPDAGLERLLGLVESEQQALEEAPRTVDPLQQTVATTIQQHMNRPEVARRDALAAIRFLSLPASSVVVRELRGHYRAFQTNGDIGALVQVVGGLAGTYSAATTPAPPRSRPQLRREDLRLICFDYLCCWP